MKRNPAKFQHRHFDVLVIGGGISGACLAADAAMRGLSVALIEKDDFGGATSSASSKLLHGGIRYLQQMNFIKVRESAQERIYFQQLAPHLTHYVPFIIPTYKSLSKGRLVMRLAMALYELICSGLNGILSDPSKHVPPSHRLTHKEVKEIIPGLQSDDNTGGIVFYESHMHSSERMTLAFVETAHLHGAVIANYLQVEGFIGAEQGRVKGVGVKDCLSGDRFEIAASLVINAAGPWIPLLNAKISAAKKIESMVNAYSSGAHIVTRSLTSGHAVALPTRKQNQAIINRGGRHVFIIPWRGYSLIGTTYAPYTGDLDDVHATEDDIDEMIEDINSALGVDLKASIPESDPSQPLTRDDVRYAFAGIYPLIDDVINTSVYQGTGKYQVIDHADTDNIEGLVSVFGAKFTTARLLAEKALDQILPKITTGKGKCTTRQARLAAGNIDDIKAFRIEQASRYSNSLPATIIDHLVTNYGSHTQTVIALIEEDDALTKRLTPEHEVIAAEIVYAVRHEMACHLDDVIFRRTGLGTLGNPGKETLLCCAALMAQELNWSEETIDKQIQTTLTKFPGLRSSASNSGLDS
jgi:glycerol-3-phosphate dehydrogenase